MPVPTIEWIGGVDGKIKIIDQTLLPNELKYVYCDDRESIFHAIKTLMVRGAPAIGFFIEAIKPKRFRCLCPPLCPLL